MKRDLHFKIRAPEMPTEEQIICSMEKQIGSSKPNCLSYWYPKLQGLGIPTPETEILTLTTEEYLNLWRILDNEYSPVLTKIKSWVEEISKKWDTPTFLRCGQTSAKHSWNRSCGMKEGDITSNIWTIAEFAAIVGLVFNVWVLRKMLPVDPICCCAGYNDMPVTEEWRLFVEGENITHAQPYWPPSAVRDGKPDTEEWEDKLAEISIFPYSSNIVELTKKIGKHLGGFWSIDWLKSKDTFYCIDMARGNQSYRWGKASWYTEEGK